MSRPIHRSSTEVIQILESAVATGGDDRFDDFISVPIAEPELEVVRRKCLAVVLAPPQEFNCVLGEAIRELMSGGTVS